MNTWNLEVSQLLLSSSTLLIWITISRSPLGWEAKLWVWQDPCTKKWNTDTFFLYLHVLSIFVPVFFPEIHQDAGLALVDATDLHSASEVSSGVRWCSLVLERLAYDHWKVFFYVFLLEHLCFFLNFSEVLMQVALVAYHLHPPSIIFASSYLLPPPSIVFGVKRQASARGGQTAAPEVCPESNPTVAEMLRMDSRCLTMGWLIKTQNNIEGYYACLD